MSELEIRAIRKDAKAIVPNGGAEGALAALIVRLCDALLLAPIYSEPVKYR